MHPFVSLFGLELSSYGIMCASGVVCAMALSLYLAYRRGYELYRVLFLVLISVVSGFIGAALLYIPVTYSPRELIRAIKYGYFSGGFVFYGGFITGILCVWILIRKLHFPPELPGAVLIPSLPLAHALGRVGCFLAGCCYGKASGSFLAVRFPGMQQTVLPVQLFESGAELLICAYLVRCSSKNKPYMICRYILLYAPVRFALEFLRGDAIRGHALWFSTSQWISLALLVLTAVYLVFAVKKSRKA